MPLLKLHLRHKFCHTRKKIYLLVSDKSGFVAIISKYNNSVGNSRRIQTIIKGIVNPTINTAWVIIKIVDNPSTNIGKLFTFKKCKKFFD